MKTYEITFNYASPLLMHSLNAMDPFNLKVKRLHELQAVPSKKRTDEQLMEMTWLDFALNAYFNEEVGLYIPAENIEACIRDAFKDFRKSKDAIVGLTVQETEVPLIYNGPRTLEELFEIPEFKDVRIVKIQNNRVPRCRPRFNRWSLKFDLDVDESIIKTSDLEMAFDIAGSKKAIGDHRPRYGRFGVIAKQTA
jgi:hypothetical protein